MKEVSVTKITGEIVAQEVYEFKKKRKEMVWTQKENQIYKDFVEKNKDILSNKVARRKARIFRKMSKVLETRTADQCRTHHQKMLQTYHNIARIIRHLKSVSTDENDQQFSIKAENHQNEGSEMQVKKQENPELITNSQKSIKLEQLNLQYMIDQDFWNLQWDWIKAEQSFGVDYLRYD